MAKDEINAFLGTGTTYQGKLNFQGSVRIDGFFKGQIGSEGTLIVGKDAKVEGEVTVGQLVLSGHVEGQIVASKKVVLHKTANLLGSLNTPVLVIEEGAKMEGEVTMGGGSPRSASGGASSGERKAVESVSGSQPASLVLGLGDENREKTNNS